MKFKIFLIILLLLSSIFAFGDNINSSYNVSKKLQNLTFPVNSTIYSNNIGNNSSSNSSNMVINLDINNSANITKPENKSINKENTTISKNLKYINNSKNIKNISKKLKHYLDISINNYKVVIKTNGMPYGFTNKTSLNVVKVSNNTYILSPILLNTNITIYSKFKNETLSKEIFVKYNPKNEKIEKHKINKTIVVKDIYFPSEKIIIKTNFKPNKAHIITPNNKTINLKIHKKGNYYYLSAKLNKNVLLGNYSVLVDRIKRNFVVDYYKINAKFNNSYIFGNVSYYVKEPKFITCSIKNKKECNISLVNGTFNISLNHFINKLNISKPEDIKEIILTCGNAKKKIKIKLKNKPKIKKIVSYNPVNKNLVIKLEGNKNEVNKILKKYKKKYSISKISQINNNVIVEIKTKANKKLLKKYSLPNSILNTTIVSEKISNTEIKVKVNNKLDNVWYKFSCKIPEGYRVKKIVGDDGRVIRNNISINRLTGEVKGELRWYVENNTLYFYDDPVYGYDISLEPPAPNNSIAVEVSYDGQDSGGCGQISAIVFPYNEGDNSSTIKSHDHAGRTGDNNYANNIDADAGSKIAIRYKSGNIIRQYGNGGDWYETAPYYLSEINRTDIPLNSVPNGILESAIITDMYAPWNDRELNITQKIIIRGNNKWFATVYYIKNPTTKTYSNLKFFQGMDWNFDGDYLNDNSYYNNSYDLVYGHKANAPINNIQYGGFKSPIFSYAHDVNQYGNMWNDISNNNLNNNSYYNGDAGTALEWYKSSLNPGEIWVVPIIWGLGYNYTDMINEINMGLSQLYDAGVKSIDYPNNGDSFNPNIQQVIYVNSTVALYGLVDAYNLNVSINITQINGSYFYSNFTLINLSVPNMEEKSISFPINISNIPYGKYNISIKTNLPNDQNTSNDEKSITIYISTFSITPNYQEKIGNAGDEIYYNITTHNEGGTSRFDINISNSTKGWTTKIYKNSSLIAEDNNGDGTWDYIASGYDSNSNGLPDIDIPNGDFNLTVTKVIPSTTPLGELDLTKLRFTDISNPTIYDDVSFQTSTPYPSSVQKTFYLHGNYLKTLNTSKPTVSNNYTTIDGYSLSSWYQSPRFADDFVVLSKIPILLYMNDPSGTNTHDIVISLIATDGSNSFTLGSDEETIQLSSNVNPYLFNISLDSLKTIPKNYYIVLRVENQNSDDSINLYHDTNHISKISLNTTTYVKISNIYNDKTSYCIGNDDVATIFANITDPIGSYDISGANITIYYPNGSLYINSSMELQSIDNNTLSFWKLYNYTFNLPVGGTYNITITGIESNGVIYESNYSINVNPKIIRGNIYEDFGTLGVKDSSDIPIPDVRVLLIKDINGNGILDINDSCINTTATNATGNYTFVLNSNGTYFVAVDSRTINTTRGLNDGYNINDIWAEETYQTNESNYSQIIPFFGGRNATINDKVGVVFFDNFENWSGWYNYSSGIVSQSNEVSDSGTYSLKKSNYNDPNGGYKLLPYNISRDVVLEGWIYRPSNWGGGSIDRIGLEDENFNGYTIAVSHSTNSIWIDKRTGGSASRISSEITWNPPEDEWYEFKLYIYKNGTITLKIYDKSGVFQKSVSANDNTYTKFDRVVVHGGYVYYVDDLKVKMLAPMYEHYVKINASKYKNESIDFGFSFDVIVNTKDTDDDPNSNRYAQGTLRQFILNSNAIKGKQRSYFIMVVNPNSNDSNGRWWTITVNSSLGSLPAIKDSVEINGTVFYPNMTVRDENPGYILNNTSCDYKANISVGIGNDNIPDSGDEHIIYAFEKPEIEINLSKQGYYGIHCNWGVSNTTLTKFAIYNANGTTYGFQAAVFIDGGGHDNKIEDCFIGLRANGSDPGIKYRNTRYGILIEENNATVRHNYIGYNGYGMVLYSYESNYYNATVEENEVFANGRTNESLDGDGIGVWMNGNIVRYNFVHNNGPSGAGEGADRGAGLEIYNGNNNNIFDNTFDNDSYHEIRIANDSSNNIIHGNNIMGDSSGPGILLGIEGGGNPFNNSIRKNSISRNHGLGIDICCTPWANGDNITLNDGKLNSSQPNYGVDYPIITYAELNGNNLYVEGFVGNKTGSSNFSNALIDIYLVKNSTDGDDLIGNNKTSSGLGLNNSYGEGWIYLGTLKTNSSGYFNGTIDVSGKGVEEGCLITATTTLNNYGTSEFGPDYLMMKKINISAGLSAIWENNHFNISIRVKSHTNARNIYVYWTKPNNSTIINITGDISSWNYAANNRTIYIKIDNISSYITKNIYINLNIFKDCDVSNIYNIGIDP